MLETILAELGRPFGSLPAEVATFRLLAAACLSGLIGFERQLRHKPAGLRTHMLVALAACLSTLVALEVIDLADVSNPAIRLDPLRVIPPITSGVAFLAAGAIIIHGRAVEGLTTGAGMWLAGVIGLACGVGSTALALIATVIALMVLTLLRLLE